MSTFNLFPSFFHNAIMLSKYIINNYIITVKQTRYTSSWSIMSLLMHLQLPDSSSCFSDQSSWQLSLQGATWKQSSTRETKTKVWAYIDDFGIVALRKCNGIACSVPILQWWTIATPCLMNFLFTGLLCATCVQLLNRIPL